MLVSKFYLVVLIVFFQKTQIFRSKNSIAHANQKPFVLILQTSLPNGTVGLACLSCSLPSWLDS
jgi:hypothetical protein